MNSQLHSYNQANILSGFGAEVEENTNKLHATEQQFVFFWYQVGGVKNKGRLKGSKHLVRRSIFQLTFQDNFQVIS